jgi:hypothetical protein
MKCSYTRKNPENRGYESIVICGSDLAGFDKPAFFDRDDIIVVHFDNIEAVFAAESVIKAVCPLKGVLLGLFFAFKTSKLLQGSPSGTAAEFFQNNVMLFHESLLLLEIR